MHQLKLLNSFSKELGTVETSLKQPGRPEPCSQPEWVDTGFLLPSSFLMNINSQNAVLTWKTYVPFVSLGANFPLGANETFVTFAALFSLRSRGTCGKNRNEVGTSCPAGDGLLGTETE